MFIHYAIALCFLVVASAQVAPGKKDARCPEIDMNVPVFLKDDKFCNRYYVCDSGLAIPMLCPHHLLWNEHMKSCDHPRNVQCDIKAPAAPVLKVYAAPSVLSSPGKKDPRCPERNPATPVFLKDDNFCNRYYVCDTGLAIPMICPHHLLFNPYKNVCDHPEAVDCHSKAPSA